MFRTPSLRDSISVALRKLLQGGRRGSQDSLQQREKTVWSSKIRYQVKELSMLCMGRCKPLGSLNSFLSYAPQLSGLILFPCSPCFLLSPSSSAITVEGWQHLLDHSFGSPHSLLEAREHWWLWHWLINMLINMAGDISISQLQLLSLRALSPCDTTRKSVRCNERCRMTQWRSCVLQLRQEAAK